MLNHQHRAVRRHRLDQRGDAVDVFVAHARRRLVEEQHLGIERDCGRKLQRPLAAVGQFDGRMSRVIFQTDVAEQRHGAIVVLVEDAFRAPEVERPTAFPLQGDAHVLKAGQMRKHGRDLKRAHKAEPRNIGRREAGDVLTLEPDAPTRWLEKLGEQVEAGGFAGSVRADERVNRAARNAQAHAVHRYEASELLGQVLGLEDRLTHRRGSPPCRPLQPHSAKSVQWSLRGDKPRKALRAETDSPPGRGPSERASRTDAQVEWGRRADRTSRVFADS